MNLDYRVLRWIQIAGVCLVAGVVSLVLFGANDWQNWILIAAALIFVGRAVIEHRHIRRGS